MPADIQTHYRACNLCEAICGLEIKTQGEQVLSIKGDKNDPLSHGYICPKGTAMQDIYTDPDRLRRPVKKQGDSWVEISWEEAFSTVAEKLTAVQDQHGADSVAFYAGNPNVHNYGSMTHASVLRKAVQTKTHFSATSLDQLPHHLTSLSLYGHQSLLPVPDIDHTNYMLIIGGNPLASNGSIMTVPNVPKRLKAIQERGGRFVVIDPRRTETAEIADQHLFIRPGTDAFLLMAMLNTLFAENLVNTGHLTDLLVGVDKVRSACESFTPELAEQRTGVAAEQIRQLARDMANIEGAVCYGRMGVSVQVYGTLCQWAINMINILTHSLDVRGGMMASSPAFGFVKPGESGAGHFAAFHSRVSGLPEFAGELPATVMAEEMLTEGEGQIRGLISIAGNPVLSAPNGQQIDQALAGLDFMVSLDFYINETTQHADIILPPTSALEHDHYDIAFHRLAVHNTARFNEAVFEPAAGTLHDWEIFNQLGQAIAAHKGMDSKPLPSPDKLVDKGIQRGPYSAAAGHELELTLDKIKQHPHGLDLGRLAPSLPERLCTSDGKITLLADYIVKDLQRLGVDQAVTEADELLLIGRRHIRSNNSWMHNSHRLVKGKPRWQLLMHPDDLAEHKIDDESQVRIQSRVGEVVTQVLASDEVMRGVVSLPHGWGHKSAGVSMGIASEQEGVSCNDLTDDQLIDQVSGNAALNGVPVKIFAAQP
ncbi:molybdopterin-dependent oxidoreductase [Porticoccaceae bacterium]|nr:molybdopterin-dependent oxidoreductase [Porticoccaceae bacterium]MDC0588868.1 molybdopterin-dependent oxidoreductase [Porticoccaceae bacterium]